MAVQMVYKSPSYITRAAKQKFGRRIKIMGVTAQEELRLWKHIDVRAVSTGKPEPKHTTVVDIKTISLVNQNDVVMNSGFEENEKENANDGFNEVEISSKSKSNQPSEKTYQLQLGDWTHGEIGDLISTKLSEANFYNSPATPVTFETGGSIKAAREIEAGKDGTLDEKHYRVTERIKVPPKTKVTATLLTKSVTYEIQIVAEFRLNADTYLPVRFKGRIEKKLGSFCTATIRRVTAMDLFCNEAGYKEVDGLITFRREGTLSYTAEEVELITDMKVI